MISRRNIRLKVMQIRYAQMQDSEKTVSRLEKSLLENINSFYRAYIYNLYLLCKTCEYTLADEYIQKSKHLPSQAGAPATTQLFYNPVIQHLITVENIFAFIEKEKLNNRMDEDYFRRFLHELKRNDEYAAYAQKANPLLPEDKEILHLLYKKVLFGNELFQQTVEEIFPTWSDDQHAVYRSVQDTITEIAPTQSPYILNRIKDLKEGKEFGLQLFRQTIEHSSEAEALLKNHVANWEVERIAILDLLLMKMCVTELLYFPDIPVKVSMNEYLELAKLYSTPKSSEFINGILDAARRQLEIENKITKTGRGMQA